MKSNIANIRTEYSLQTLKENEVDKDALKQFERWWQEAINSNIEEVNAMTLATATKEGITNARIVLLKAVDTSGFSFFTNYSSHKGKELEANPHAALVFFWKELERQIRIQGIVEKLNEHESDAYFFSRPEGSRIGAWASPQSSVINDRKVLDENVKKYIAKFPDFIPRPPHWGGYRLRPLLVEFWQGRGNRLHDRLQYSLIDSGTWKIERLAP